MLIGIMEIKIYIPYSHSLKDKRRVTKSLLTRLRNQFNVSAAEIGSLEHWQISIIAISLVGGDTVFLNKCLTKISSFLERETEFEIIDICTQVL